MFQRDYINLEQDEFKYELKNKIQIQSIKCHGEFEKVFVDILSEHAPCKIKFLRANHAANGLN